eukprot:1995294-Pyramimonas_sp.AAC.2
MEQGVRGPHVHKLTKAGAENAVRRAGVDSQFMDVGSMNSPSISLHTKGGALEQKRIETSAPEQKKTSVIKDGRIMEQGVREPHVHKLTKAGADNAARRAGVDSQFMNVGSMNSRFISLHTKGGALEQKRIETSVPELTKLKKHKKTSVIKDGRIMEQGVREPHVHKLTKTGAENAVRRAGVDSQFMDVGFMNSRAISLPTKGGALEQKRIETSVPVFKVYGDGNCAARAIYQWQKDPYRKMRYVKSTGLPWTKEEKVQGCSNRPPRFAHEAHGAAIIRENCQLELQQTGFDEAGLQIRGAVENGEDWEAYVERMGKDGEYFDAPMLMKLAEFYEHPVVVFCANWNTGTVYTQTYGAETHGDEPAIPLWYNGVNHYDL